MKTYRIVQRGVEFFIQEKWFIFWQDAEVHPTELFSRGYKTIQEAENVIRMWKHNPDRGKDIVVGYY